MKKPLEKIVIYMSGDIIQAVHAGRKMDVVIMNEDTFEPETDGPEHSFSQALKEERKGLKSTY